MDQTQHWSTDTTLILTILVLIILTIATKLIQGTKQATHTEGTKQATHTEGTKQATHTEGTKQHRNGTKQARNNPADKPAIWTIVQGPVIVMRGTHLQHKQHRSNRGRGFVYKPGPIQSPLKEAAAQRIRKEKAAAAHEWRKRLDHTDKWRRHLDAIGCGDALDQPTKPSLKRVKPKYIKQLERHLANQKPCDSVCVHDATKFRVQVANCNYLSKARTSRPRAIWDSGATHGVHHAEGLFSNKHRPVVTHIRGISGTKTQIQMGGTCEGLHGVLHMPNVSQPIIALGQFLDQVGGQLVFSRTHLYLLRDNNKTLVGRRNEQGLYETCMSTQEAKALTAKTADINLSVHAQVLREKVYTLHRSLGHIGRHRMKQVLQRNNFTNLSVKDLDLLLSCDACQTGQIKKAARPKRATRRATTFGHTIRSDSTSKQPTRTFNKKRYANICVDEATRWSFVKLLRTLKHTTSLALKPLLKTELKGKTRIFGSDQGSEFINNELDALLGSDQLGIMRQAACADDQSQNGLAERTIGVLFAMVRTIIADAKLPLSFWGELLIAANYLRNRLPTSANANNASPFEMRYGKPPDLRNLRPLGVRCTVLKHSNKIDGAKAKARGLKGILVGYGEPFGLKGWRVYLPEKHAVVTAPNVLFLDDMQQSLGYRTPTTLLAGDPSTLIGIHDPGNANEVVPTPVLGSDSDTSLDLGLDQSLDPANQSQPIGEKALDERQDPMSADSPLERPLEHSPDSEDVGSEGDSESDGQTKPTRFYTSEETKTNPGKGHQYLPEDDPFFAEPGIFDDDDGEQPDGPPSRRTRLQRKLQQNPDTFINTMNAIKDQSQTDNFINTMNAIKDQFQINAYVYVAQDPFAADVDLPSSYRDALAGIHGPQWKAAIDAEITSLQKLDVFKIVKRNSLPRGANIISGRWVFKVKPQADGTIDKFKCRLCAKGFLQKHGVDFTSTFSPVANAASIKLLLAIAQKLGLELRSADVSTAFLFAELPVNERVYMEAPAGINAGSDEVLELNRCIYGLKQASRRWYDKLRTTLETAGYKSTRADPCVYTRNKNNEYTIIATVVDDLIIASSTTKGAKRVCRMMVKAGLDTKDLGQPEYIIGMHVRRTRTGITLNQELYINTLLRRFNMENAHPCNTPADPNVKLGKIYEPTTTKQKEDMQAKPYRALVGGLLYLILTRPDIAVAVNELCRHLSNPGAAMWTAAKRVLRYLKGTTHYKIRFSSSYSQTGNNLHSYVDASFADDRDTRRSRCGYIVYFDQSPVTWKTTLQKRVALSTAEAEYRAATIATKEIVWLRRLLKELSLPQKEPTVFFEDNTACMKMIENPMVSLRNKHVETDAHFVRDHYMLGSIIPMSVSSLEQKADLFTKNLARPLFERHTFSILDTRPSR
jgi:hypothetical protein